MLTLSAERKLLPIRHDILVGRTSGSDPEGQYELVFAWICKGTLVYNINEYNEI